MYQHSFVGKDWSKNNVQYPPQYHLVRIRERISPEEATQYIQRAFSVYGQPVKTDSPVLIHIHKRITVHGDCGCAFCNKPIAHYHVERSKSDLQSPFRLTPYIISDEGVEFEITWDHIIPKTLGGSNHSVNSQILCRFCNTDKGWMIDQQGLELIHQSPHVLTPQKLLNAIYNTKPKQQDRISALSVMCIHIIESARVPDKVRNVATTFLSGGYNIKSSI
jgi:hypothetical protein